MTADAGSGVVWETWRDLERGGLLPLQEERLPVFERTRRFRTYSPTLVCGLLQTAAYTEDVLRNVRTRRDVPDDVMEAVASRMARQRVLLDRGKEFAFVIEEHVLRNAVGDARTQIEQLDRLLTTAELPHVRLGIVPGGLGRARVAPEGFWVYDSDAASVELVSGYLRLTAPADVQAYADVFAELDGMAAHDDAALALIARARAAFA
ncbi:DUF5753 domain-containing protein [Streptomyces sp. NPDC088923]|uniref:DUF5753 domain-containing protein n=1 Tax=Streptomyces sp. NPDC088923 TaxID=3365913 RepID=UPI003822F4C6